MQTFAEKKTPKVDPGAPSLVHFPWHNTWTKCWRKQVPRRMLMFTICALEKMAMFELIKTGTIWGLLCINVCCLFVALLILVLLWVNVCCFLLLYCFLFNCVSVFVVSLLLYCFWFYCVSMFVVLMFVHACCLFVCCFVVCCCFIVCQCLLF